MAYEIVDGGRMIRCLQCGMGSYNPRDVEKRYCALCRMFHDDYERLGMEAGRPAVAFKPGDVVMRGRRLFKVVTNEGFYGKVVDEGGVKQLPFHWFHDGEWCRRIP